MLGWHYRSRSESLISFSNWAFYDGRLLTVPGFRLPLPPRIADSVADGEPQSTGIDLLLGRPSRTTCSRTASTINGAIPRRRTILLNS